MMQLSITLLSYQIKLKINSFVLYFAEIGKLYWFFNSKLNWHNGIRKNYTVKCNVLISMCVHFLVLSLYLVPIKLGAISRGGKWKKVS